MRFLADVPIARATMEHLRRQGHDCVGVRERLSPTAKDEQIVHLAAIESRVILCFDLDMATLVALSGGKLPSVVTFRTSRHHPEFISHRLDEVLPELTPELHAGVLATVEDHRVRVRPLPVRPPGGR